MQKGNCVIYLDGFVGLASQIVKHFSLELIRLLRLISFVHKCIQITLQRRMPHKNFWTFNAIKLLQNLIFLIIVSVVASNLFSYCFIDIFNLKIKWFDAIIKN